MSIMKVSFIACCKVWMWFGKIKTSAISCELTLSKTKELTSAMIMLLLKTDMNIRFGFL